MNSTDLKGLFAKYVTDYKVGVDDVITKHVGEYQESSSGVEAELDIQYIMGVSPGIQTEFWEFPGQDFGADMNMWTSNLTAQSDIPLVHSVSYGQLHPRQPSLLALLRLVPNLTGRFSFLPLQSVLTC